MIKYNIYKIFLKYNSYTFNIEVVAENLDMAIE